MTETTEKALTCHIDHEEKRAAVGNDRGSKKIDDQQYWVPYKLVILDAGWVWMLYEIVPRVTDCTTHSPSSPLFLSHTG